MERNVLVDRLKGYACFLVLLGHVIRGIQTGGIDIPPCFESIELFIWSFHVALFLFLSGVVYRLTGEWKNYKTKGAFILHKLIGLGIPYITFSIIYITINSMVSGVNTRSSIMDILWIWKTPVAQYWYLYALFFLFCIWTLLSGILKNWQITVFALIVGYGVPLLGASLGSFEVVFYSSLAFGMGTIVNFQKLTQINPWLKAGIVLMHLAAGAMSIGWGIIASPIIKEFMLLLGIYASILLISVIQRCKPFAKFLDFMIRYSFQIYLLHTIFTAETRVLLLRLGITQWWIHVPAGIVCGLTFPVLIAIVANKIRILKFFFFPTKAFRKERVLQK